MRIRLSDYDEQWAALFQEAINNRRSHGMKV
jgi:hypothetical protein